MFPIFKIIFNTGSGKLVSIQISTIATIMKEEFLDASRETDFSPFSSLKRTIPVKLLASSDTMVATEGGLPAGLESETFNLEPKTN
jgi:hypothetical protein